MPLAAQTPNPSGPVIPADRSRALQKLDGDALRQAAKKKEVAIAERHQRELAERLAAFAKSWNRLIKEAESGVWNAREAKKTHQAFERLVRAQGWVE